MPTAVVPVNLITYGTLEALGEALRDGTEDRLLGDPATIYDRIVEVGGADPVLSAINVAVVESNLANWYYWSVPAPMTVHGHMNGFPIYGIDSKNNPILGAEDFYFVQHFLSHEAPGTRYLQIRLRCAVLSLLNSLNLLPPCPQQ